jgi:hypothetical protein
LRRSEPSPLGSICPKSLSRKGRDRAHLIKSRSLS